MEILLLVQYPDVPLFWFMSWHNVTEIKQFLCMLFH
jgi:hypothetical protein